MNYFRDVKCKKALAFAKRFGEAREGRWKKYKR